MFFSKSFGYALRGILYIAVFSDKKERILADEIAGELAVPKHFFSKIMKIVVKKKILNSTKGPHGGFSVNENTLSTPLIDLFKVTNENTQFNKCLLGLKACNPIRPCPLHYQMTDQKKEFLKFLSTTTIGDLLQKDEPGFVNSLSSL